VTTDLLGTALVQLATLMAATWTLTEAIGARVTWPKLAISLLLGTALSMAAYGLGWFTALPAATATAIPIAGVRGYLSAGFAGLVGAAVTSAAHAALVGSKTGGTERG
jgi:hypothetical protein